MDTRIDMRVKINLPGNKHDRKVGIVRAKPSAIMSEVDIEEMGGGSTVIMVPNRCLKRV